MYTTAVRVPAVGSDAAGAIEGHGRGEGPAMKGATTTATRQQQTDGTARRRPGRPRSAATSGPRRADPPVTDAERQRLQRAMDYLVGHACTAPSMRDLAAVTGLSPFHFHRRFSLCFGETPKAATTRHQVEQVKQLLLAGVAIDEAARQCGFAHQSHLTSRFRQLVGQPPGRWLRARQVEAAEAARQASEQLEQQGERKGGEAA